MARSSPAPATRATNPTNAASKKLLITPTVPDTVKKAAKQLGVTPPMPHRTVTADGSDFVKAMCRKRNQRARLRLKVSSLGALRRAFPKRTPF
jgi:hypothetical protein